jgi:hypothetical protein
LKIYFIFEYIMTESQSVCEPGPEEQRIIDAPNLWYLLSGNAGESINDLVIRNNKSSQNNNTPTSLPIYDASLAFISNGNDGITPVGDYATINACDVGLKSAVRKDSGLSPFKIGNWAKINDLDGKLGASVGTWVLTKEKYFNDISYNILIGSSGNSAAETYYGKIFNEPSTTILNTSQSLFTGAGGSGVTPTKVDGSIIQDVSGNYNNSGFYNRSFMTALPSSDQPVSDFLTYDLRSQVGLEIPIINTINKYNEPSGIGYIDYCYGTLEGNYMIAGDRENSIYKITLDNEPGVNNPVVATRLDSLSDHLFTNCFTSIYDVTWIKNPVTGMSRWFFCGETNEPADPRVVYVDNLGANPPNILGAVTACKTPLYTTDYPISISSTQTLDDNNPRSCPIGITGKNKSYFTRGLSFVKIEPGSVPPGEQQSQQEYIFDQIIENEDDVEGKKCKLLQVESKKVLFMNASKSSNWSTINLEESGSAKNQQFFRYNNGKLVQSNYITYLPQSNYGNGLIGLTSETGEGVKNLSFIYELRNGWIPPHSQNNPYVVKNEEGYMGNGAKIVTLIPNRYNI